MRALIAQLAPRPGDQDANAATVAAALAEHPDVDLAVFPELFLCGYEASLAAAHALAPGDGPLRSLQAVAQRHGTALVLGFAERLPDGGVANALACIDRDGRWVATYRKAFLFGAAERAVFTPGDALRVIELAGRRVAPLICFDVEFPEPARAVARAGAELLVTAAANMEPYGHDHALAACARALDNRRPHLYVNRVGREAGLRFVGGSAAIGPDGRPTELLGEEARLAVVALEIDAATTPNDVDYLEHLRDDLAVEATSTSTKEATR